MSILIKGMEMPKDCWHCGFRYNTDYGFNLCQAYSPPMRIFSMPAIRHKYKDCPLVEIQEPHGDLIDRSGLLHDLASLHIGGIEAISDMNKVWGDTWDAGLHSAWRTIDDADAVIPASEDGT